jgi:hypothetical protein
MKAVKHLVLTVERDGVCAGDDIESPHTRRFKVRPDATLAEALSEILGKQYLALIIGGKATWVVESDKPLAVVAQQWKSPRFLVDPDTPVADCVPPGGPKPLYFRYWVQADPVKVLRKLRAGQPAPEKSAKTAEHRVPADPIAGNRDSGVGARSRHRNRSSML